MIDKPQYILAYESIINDIQNLHHFNILNKIIDLYNLDESSEHKAIALYKILYEMGKYKLNLPTGYTLYQVHTIIHYGILNLGIKKYKELLGSLTNFIDAPHKMLLVSPILKNESLLAEYNHDSRFMIGMGNLELCHTLNYKVDGEAVKNLFDHFKSNIKYLNLMTKLSMIDVSLRPTIENVILEHFDVCEGDAANDTIAIYLEDCSMLNNEIREYHSYLIALKQMGYRIALIHHSLDDVERSMGFMFDDFIRVNRHFSVMTARTFLVRRYRLLLCPTINEWSLFFMSVGLGIKQMTFEEVHIDNVDYCHTGDKSMTLINVDIKKLKKNPDYKYCVCPWELTDITKKNITKLPKGHQYVFPVKHSAMVYAAKLNILGLKDYIIYDKGINGYHAMINIADIVYCTNNINLVDTLNVGKDMMGMDYIEDIAGYAKDYNKSISKKFKTACKNKLGL